MRAFVCNKRDEMKVTKALILAGGKGTRMLPYTKAVSKEMLAVMDKPAIQLLVEEVVSCGITDVCVVLSPEKTDVLRYFTRDEQYEAQLSQSGKEDYATMIKTVSQMAQFTFVYQQTANGAAKAVCLAQQWANGQPFVVLNGDDVIFNDGDSATKQVVDAYEQTHCPIIGVQPVQRKDIYKYASCKVTDENATVTQLLKIVEKPQRDCDVFSLLAPLGRYVLDGNFFQFVDKTYQRKGEVFIADVITTQMEQYPVYVCNFKGKRFDFGSKLGYAMGFAYCALQDDTISKDYKQYLLSLLEENKGETL